MTTSLLICARAVHFASGMVLLGVVAFRWLVFLPVFAGESEEVWQKFLPLLRKLSALFIGSGIFLIISGFALFWAVAAGMSDMSLTESLNRETFSTVLLLTQFGTVCQLRLGLAVLLGAMMWSLSREHWLTRSQSSWLEAGAGLVAMALVASVAWTGHAAAAGGFAFWWRVLADTAHLLATSIWPTGLLPFALFLGCARRIENPALLRPVLAVAQRFSHVSFITVWILMASGLMNTWFMVGSLSALANTDYGHLLCLKLALFIIILVIAARNRYRLVPLLTSSANPAEKDHFFKLVRYLQNFVTIEFLLALAIVLVVSVLGITPPPH